MTDSSLVAQKGLETLQSLYATQQNPLFNDKHKNSNPKLSMHISENCKKDQNWTWGSFYFFAPSPSNSQREKTHHPIVETVPCYSLEKKIETFETELGVFLLVSCTSQTCSNAGRQAAWRQQSQFLTGRISSNINHNIILWTWGRCSLWRKKKCT